MLNQIHKNTTILKFTLLILVLAITGCSAENVANTKLAKHLEKYDYTLYAPFRTEAKPGTIFILAKNHQGKATEFLISSHKETFDLEPSDLFDLNGQEVEWADEINETFTLNGSIAAQLASVAVNPELSLNYSESFQLKLGDPKTTHVMSLGALNRARFDLNENINETLRHYRKSGNLENVYLVLETLTVESLEITVTLKDEFKATIGLEEVKELTSTDASITSNGDGRFAVSFTKPMMIGYKAMLFPDTIIAEEVSALPIQSLNVIPATTLNKAK